jgi:hypothetical protein
MSRPRKAHCEHVFHSRPPTSCLSIAGLGVSLASTDTTPMLECMASGRALAMAMGDATTID